MMGCPMLVGAYALQLEDAVFRGPVTSKPGVRRGAGQLVRAGGIAADQVAAVAVVDEAGNEVELTAVVNNVFTFHGPFPKGFLRLAAFDGQGNRLEPRPAQGEHQAPPPGLFGPRVSRVKPTRLGVVAQRGSSEGVTVSVGRNATVVFEGAARDDLTARALQRGRVGFHCFVVTGQNLRNTKGTWIYARWRPPVAFRVNGLEPPFDGCDIQGTYGHRWRDRYGTHSLVEVSFTDRGRRYFADRATARDLALFVRSRTTRELRKLTGPPLIAALRRAYGDKITILASSDRFAPIGQVGVYVDGPRTVFSERSSIGHRLYVELENGRIVDENLRGLAFVF